MTDIDPAALDRWITGDYGAQNEREQRAYAHSLRRGPCCPDCGCEDVSDRQGHIRPDGDERPPWLMVCERCGHEWEEDE